MILKNGSESWKQWIDPQVPVYMKFYIFNTTNPNEFAQGKEIPNLVQVGPFVFQEIRTKNVETISEDLSRVLYSDERAFIFVESLSEPLDSEIIFLNVPANVS